mgnify:CR=1 FL=1
MQRRARRRRCQLSEPLARCPRRSAWPEQWLRSCTGRQQNHLLLRRRRRQRHLESRRAQRRAHRPACPQRRQRQLPASPARCVRQLACPESRRRTQS